MGKSGSKQYYRWVFTWSVDCCEVPGVLHNILRRTFTSLSFKSWVFSLEQGENASTYHYQGRFSLSKKSVKKTLMSNILSEFANHLQDPDLVKGAVLDEIFSTPERARELLTIAPEMDEAASIKYCSKSKTNVLGPWSYPEMYFGEDIKEAQFKMLPWQNYVIIKVRSELQSREINWVVDERGNSGKSFLMKYLCFHNDHYGRVPLGTAAQIKCAVISMGPKKVYFLDIPRTTGKDERLQELFSAIEEIKNGWVMSAMYGSPQELMMVPPQVWVFSNDRPDKSLVSLDRWRVWSIDPIYQLSVDPIFHFESTKHRTASSASLDKEYYLEDNIDFLGATPRGHKK